jgi:HEAT repeat protein
LSHRLDDASPGFRSRFVKRKKLLRPVLAFAVLAILGGLLLSQLPMGEPKYHGITLSSWLERYDNEVDADPQRSEAAAAVRQIGSNAVPTLIRWLGVSDSKFKQKLEEWADKQSVINFNFVDEDDYHERAAKGFQLLGAQGKAAIPDLGRMLRDTNATENAAGVLCLFGQDAVPVLIGGLTNSDAEIRRATASAMSGWNSTAESSPDGRYLTLPVPLLLTLLKDTETDVRIFATESLEEAALRKAVQPEVAMPVLIQELKDPDPRCRDEAAVALTGFGAAAKDAIPIMLDALKQNHNLRPAGGVYLNRRGYFAATLAPHVTGYYVMSFPQSAQPGPMTGVHVTTGSSNVNSANYVQAAPMIMSDGDFILHSLQALHAEPSQVIPVLEDELRSGDVPTRYWAAGALGSYGKQATSSVPLLLQFAAEQKPNLRPPIMRALDKIDPETARANFNLIDLDYRNTKLVPSLIQNLLNGDPFVRKTAAYHLGNFGPDAKSAVPALTRALDDGDGGVRAAAAEAMKKIDPAAAQNAGVK